MKMRFRPAVFALLLLLLCLPQGFAQSAGNENFPDGSTQGTTDLSDGMTGIDFPNITFSATAPQTGKEVAFSVELLLLLSLLTLAPSLILLLTCFLRFSIVLDFIKRALSLQQVPPTAVLNGIALVMTLFCMKPTLQKIYDDAFAPLYNEQITLQEAYTKAEAPIRDFMFRQMSNVNSSGKLVIQRDSATYIDTFRRMAGLGELRNRSDLPTYILVPAYILHELTVAFKIGILLYIPFIVIDMVVASILMSMGMMMLPPVQISMPFKLMLFVLVDGWGLLTAQLFQSVVR